MINEIKASFFSKKSPNPISLILKFFLSWRVSVSISKLQSFRNISFYNFIVNCLLTLHSDFCFFFNLLLNPFFFFLFHDWKIIINFFIIITKNLCCQIKTWCCYSSFYFRIFFIRLFILNEFLVFLNFQSFQTSINSINFFKFLLYLIVFLKSFFSFESLFSTKILFD